MAQALCSQVLPAVQHAGPRGFPALQGNVRCSQNCTGVVQQQLAPQWPVDRLEH